MKPRPIGIIGGAGPLAGALLLERVISLAGRLYGCNKDADFPAVFLLSFPFSDMLSHEINVQQLRKELSECLRQLRQNGAAVLAIACNTLHAFLDEKEDLSDLIHLPQTIANEFTSSEVPLVLCTTTSLQFGLHRQFFPCNYPDAEIQLQIDKLIQQILEGCEPRTLVQELLQIIADQTANTIVLGCTELSLFTKHFSSCNKLIIDPIEIVANLLVKKSFNYREKLCQ